MTEYLKKINIDIYMKDALILLLNYRKKNPNVIVNNFFADYYQCVKNGNHILHRNFEFIKSTPYNRKCFVKIWWDFFQSLTKNKDFVSIAEIQSLLTLLCPDFPEDIIKSIYQLCSDNIDASLSILEFSYRFQFYFIFEDFIDQLSNEYHSIISKGKSNESESSNDCLPTMDWLRILNKFSTVFSTTVHPDLVSMTKMISNHASLNLSEFYYHLINNEDIVREIGIMNSVCSTNNNSIGLNGADNSKEADNLDKDFIDMLISNNGKKSKSPTKIKTQINNNKKGKLIKADSVSSLQTKSSSIQLESGNYRRRRKSHSQLRKSTKSNLMGDVDDEAFESQCSSVETVLDC